MNIKRLIAQEVQYRNCRYDRFIMLYYQWQDEYELAWNKTNTIIKLTKKSHETYIRRRPFRHRQQDAGRNAGISKK